MEGSSMKAGFLRVLVVDDSPVDRKIAEGLLKRSNGEGCFHVIAVDSGKKAMELLGLNETKEASSAANEQTIDVVLTDYCMPEMTGYDLLKAIKEQSFPKPIPVIVMSSENDSQRINRCLTAGAEDFIVKPLQTKDVQRLRNCSTYVTRQLEPNTSVNKEEPSNCTPEKSRPDSRARLSEAAMVLKISGAEVSHYVPFLCKFVLLVYAMMFIAELLQGLSYRCFPMLCA